MRNTRWLFVTGAVTLAALFVVAAGSQGNDKKPGTAPISVEMLREQPVIGDLGVPLGTITEIRGTIVAGRTLKTKLYSEEYLINVAEAGGHRLKEPRILSFGVYANQPNVQAVLPRTERQLGGDSWKSGELVDLAKLEKEYLGKEFRLRGYEIGGFRGIPRNWPEGGPVYADVGFGFQTELVIISVLQQN